MFSYLFGQNQTTPNKAKEIAIAVSEWTLGYNYFSEILVPWHILPQIDENEILNFNNSFANIDLKSNAMTKFSSDFGIPETIECAQQVFGENKNYLNEMLFRVAKGEIVQRSNIELFVSDGHAFESMSEIEDGLVSGLSRRIYSGLVKEIGNFKYRVPKDWGNLSLYISIECFESRFVTDFEELKWALKDGGGVPSDSLEALEGYSISELQHGRFGAEMTRLSDSSKIYAVRAFKIGAAWSKFS